MQTYPLYINGEFVETKEQLEVLNPSTGEVCARACVASDEEVEAAIAASRKAFDEGEWRHISLEERKGFIQRIAQGILDNAAELAQLETLNTGKPIKESTFMDIPSAARTFEYIATIFQQYLTDETINVQDACVRLRREPRGVVVLIVPWNYPLLIASWKLASALAAGNTVILKPSSLTPLSALELAKIVHAAGLPAGVVNILNAQGERIGAKLCADKRVDMVSFTGSNAVGRKIIASCTEHTKKMILELGGKSAGIVCKDADLELAVNGSLCSIFLNQGQMCTAMSRIFVHEDIFEAFLEDFVTKAKRIKLGVGLDHETQMGPLISEAQRKKVAQFVQRAQKEGATLACGGKIPQAQGLQQGFFFEPTVITGASISTAIFREEVFGPVAIINKFSTMEEAVTLANSTDFALAACIWSSDTVTAQEIAKNINAGIIWINTYGMFYNEVPYGGFKQSGFGKELGREGFLEYTRLKNCITDQIQEAKPLVNYWYGF